MLRFCIFLFFLSLGFGGYSQATQLVFQTDIEGNTEWFEPMTNGNGFALSYSISFSSDLEVLDIGIWNPDTIELSVDDLLHSAIVVYNSELEPISTVRYSAWYNFNLFPVSDSRIILGRNHFLTYNPIYFSTLPEASGISPFTFGQGLYLYFNPLTDSLASLLHYSSPLLPDYNEYPYEGYWWAVIGFQRPSNQNQRTSALLNDSTLIGYFQLFDEQAINDSIVFSPWNGQVNLVRVKVNLNSNEIDAHQMGSSSGNLFPLWLQSSGIGDGLYFAGIVRGNNTPVSLSGAQVEMASNDSLYHVFITKESADGTTQWLTQLYAYNNALPDTTLNSVFKMQNVVYSMVENADNLYLSLNFYGVISIDDTLFYSDFSGEHFICRDTIPYTGSQPEILQTPIAESCLYRIDADGNIIGKLSFNQGITEEILHGAARKPNDKVFAVADKLAWVHDYYTASDTTFQFTYKTADGITQTTDVDIPEGRGTFILWLDAELNSIDYWLFPYISEADGVANHINGILPYGSDTLLIQGSISGLTKLDLNPFGVPSWVQSTEQWALKSYFAFYYAPEILTGTNLVEGGSITFAVYPNPARNNLFISGLDSELTRYRIYDLSGRMIRAGRNDAGEGIDISNLTKGMYLLKIDSEQGSGSRKFVVE